MKARQQSGAWLGLDQSAQALGVSVRTVQNMARRGELERRQRGRRSQYRVLAEAPGAAAAPVASIASFEALQSRLDDLELEVEDRTAELEQRIDELQAELHEEQKEREELETELEQAKQEVLELQERVDELEADLP